MILQIDIINEPMSGGQFLDYLNDKYSNPDGYIITKQHKHLVIQKLK